MNIITKARSDRTARTVPWHGLSIFRFASATLFLLSSFPLGVFWFVVLVTLIFAGVPLTIVWIGLPILAFTMQLCISGARVERWRLAKFLDVHVPPPHYRPTAGGSILARTRTRAADPSLWRSLGYLLLLFPIGIVEFVLAVVAVTIPTALLTYPLWFWALPNGGAQVGPGVWLDTLLESLITVPVGALAVPVAVIFILWLARRHADLGLAFLGPSSREKLVRRVEVLSESRSRAVGSAITERRKIERDLHDGAQQRLVSLAMDLGMAKEKMTEDPDAARELVGGAHAEAKRVLKEIRDLVRGIYPAILTDRGLDDALSALADRCPVPTTVEVELSGRLSEEVETTAYFVVSEALSNVAKHARASEARVALRREQGPESQLVVEVTDDGRGGASPANGGGLSGLADRLAALDGHLFVESPQDGSTSIRAEIPLKNSSPERPLTVDQE